MSTLLKITTFIILFLFTIITVSAVEYGPNYDKNCSNGICTYNIYSNIKYYQENGIWKEINESFGTVNCAIGYDYCVDKNLYQFHIKNIYAPPLVTYGNTKVSLNLTGLSGLTKSNPTAEISSNIVTYKDIYPGIDLRYIYLPTKVKEEIIIKNSSAIAFLASDLLMDFKINTFGNNATVNSDSVIFSDNGQNQLFITDLIAYDNNENIDLSFSATKTGNEVDFRLTIPIDWLKNESRSYPISIDPTIELADPSIRWNGYVQNGSGFYRINNPINFLKVGFQRDQQGMAITKNDYRSSIEWNISALPTDSEILDINLTIFINRSGNFGSENLSFWSMENNSDTYEDNFTGNRLFYIDMGNGTQFANITTQNGTFSVINLGSAKAEIENKLRNNKTLWAVGIKALTTDFDTNGALETRVSPKDHINLSQKPVLTLKIRAANESTGDAAIEQGILSSIPNAIIHNEKQVYVRYANGTQQLGRFDKVAINGTQAWAINYVTEGESFTNMNNISNKFIVFELTDLTGLQISQKVKESVSATLA